jgi:alpha-L-fucosidase
MTLGNNWGYVPGDQMKEPEKVIHTLIEVVAKGGSLLLGVGPKPDGTLSDTVVERLQKIGQWLEKNGSAIYNTRTVKAYRDSTTYFTQSKTGAVRYALVCRNEKEPVPAAVTWKGNLPKRGTKVKWVPTGEALRWRQEGGQVVVQLPAAAKTAEPIPAFAFSFTPSGD